MGEVVAVADARAVCPKDGRATAVSVSGHLLFSAFVVSLNGLFFGMNLVAVGPVLQLFGRDDFDGGVRLTPDQFGVVLSLISLGALISNIGLAFFHRHSGKSMILSAAFLYLTGLAILLFFPKTFLLLCVSRLFSGFAMGIDCVAFVLYISRILPKSHVDFFYCIHEMISSISMFISKAVTYAFCNAEKWKDIFIVYASMAVIQIGLAFAIKLDGVVHGKRRHRSKPITALLANSDARRSIITVVLLHLFQHLSCVNSMFFFSSEIFDDVGMRSDICEVWMTATIVPSAILSMFVVKTMRRKLCITISFLMVCGCLTALSLDDNRVAVIAVFAFFVSYAIGLGPVVWLITSDAFPREFAKSGQVLASAVNWSAGFVAPFLWNHFYANYGKGIFRFYAGFMAAGAIFAVLGIKETKGRTNKFL